ncbi:unnamed protein product [Rotaria sp. Silwood2]|nr:unnamed protein product [Rotaria sp. Silwood2]CAF4231886.1 unnamed protein product [Rotaria sp. Silwood2]
MYRSNAPAQTAEDYYRVNLFILILGHFIVPLPNRFSAHQWLAYNVSILIPSMLEQKPFINLKDSIIFYGPHLPSSSSIREQFQYTSTPTHTTIQRAKHIPISDPLLQEKARQIAEEFGL